MQEILTARENIVTIYRESLPESIQQLKIREGTEWNYSYYPIVMYSEDELIENLKIWNSEGVFPRRYFYPSLNTLNYVTQNHLSISEQISSRVLCLPVFYSLDKSQIDTIIKILI
jgi:dTDP-4-amino-4,6-dideoxygalactose transaminase